MKYILENAGPKGEPAAERIVTGEQGEPGDTGPPGLKGRSGPVGDRGEVYYFSIFNAIFIDRKSWSHNVRHHIINRVMKNALFEINI